MTISKQGNWAYLDSIKELVECLKKTVIYSVVGVFLIVLLMTFNLFLAVLNAVLTYVTITTVGIILMNLGCNYNILENPEESYIIITGIALSSI